LKSSANLNFKLISKNNDCEFYFKKEYIPQYKELKIILNKINKFKPHFIFGIGGGCVLDYSKLSKLLYQKINIKKIIQKNLIIKNNYKVKLYLFPTTAGSGSEATTFSAIYFNNYKMSYDNKKNIVDKIIYLPKVLTKCKKYNRSSSGIDAFNQSLESIFSRSSNSKSINYSKKSLVLIFKFLIEHINKPKPNTSKQMARAAFYSGKAINIAKTNAPHALSYPFTYYYNIDHGYAVSLTFLNVLKFNYKNINSSFNPKILKNRFKFVFEIFKVNNINSLIDKVTKIYKKANVRTSFKEYNIDIKKEKKLIIKNVNLQRLNNNPVLIKKIDLENKILID
jgi:alcohol dehydrogenase class IV